MKLPLWVYIDREIRVDAPRGRRSAFRVGEGALVQLTRSAAGRRNIITTARLLSVFRRLRCRDSFVRVKMAQMAPWCLAASKAMLKIT